MNERREVWVRADGGRRDYPVILESGVRERLVPLLHRFVPEVGRWAVITDANVAPLHGEGVAMGLAAAGLGGTLITMPAGEREKTRRTWAALTDRLLEEEFGRDGGVLAVGGGVVGDVAGFVAATFMRGIPVVQLPTSLLAMIDASVGGKTGVDTRTGKNLVGAFHPPALVVVDPETVATLPREERAQGLVEALKHGTILDEAYGDRVADHAASILAGDPHAVQSVVHRSVELKARVVSDDEREAGVREILNFGHTVGHALERAAGYALPHGTAVAQGMLWEARLGMALGVTAPGTEDTLRRWMEPLGIALDPAPVDAGTLAAALRADKKARDRTPRVVLLGHPGTVARTPDGSWAHPVSEDAILAAAPWGRS